MARRTEYRVRWRREGRRESTAIYQSHASAYRKAEGILALEAVKDQTTYEGLPDLIEGPVIEARPVGGWDPVEHQITEVEDFTKESLLDHMRAVGKAEYPERERFLPFGGSHRSET